ncbi:LysR substrate-binding domain-containing protein [Streptomyces iconiensis]|uniref:LysR substrate-binding domain-containing protein n=1 Tax=Streptomyces iconiensis TaxID=1384038 RepID=A0ABT6ZVJ4_9ACTN|nr:LysR substrate-binding domain-containing protein [Streptomyces iconiensis]MDJ1133086.1 LysR substrate-binding domain-containing protein [Streptomyces iconiensis]
MRLLVRDVRQLQRLVVLEAVGRLGSFTAAAAELGMSQPAVSKQMKALEGSLRTGLFERGTNRSRMTRDGALLHQTVTEAFDILEARLSRLRGRADQLRVAVQPSVAESWFVPRLADMRAAVAPTDVQLTIFDSEHEPADIDHDVSVRFGDGPSPGLRSEQLVTEAVVPVASPELAGRLGLTPRSEAEALLSAPLLHVDQTGRSWQDWASWFAGNGLAHTAPAHTVVYPTYGSAVPLAISGNGVLLSWRTLMGDHLRRGLLREVGPVVTVPGRGYFLQWPPALTRDAGFQRFRAWLRETVSSQGEEDVRR